MSRQLAEEDLDGFKDSLHYSFELLLLLILPATIGLMLCAVPVYSVFFMGGEFAYEAVKQSGLALVAYAPGLLCVGLSRVVVPAFYAMKDTRTPVWVSFWTLLINAGFGLVLMQYWSHVGLAIALTLASLFNALVLLWLLRRRIGELRQKTLVQSMAKILPAVAIMGTVVWSVLQAGHWGEGSERFHNSIVLTAAVFYGGLVYLFACRMFGVRVLNEVGGMLKRKRT
jgi:putative peptidoglycan lipid II flippase